MPRKSTKLPAFKSDAEEADWYASPQGRRQTRREFERALKMGTLQVHSKGLNVKRTDPKILEQLLEEAQRNATRAVSLRLSIADIQRAREIAERQGIGYQTVLKQAIREGLKRAS